jgi:hypothetical protein
MYTHIHTPACVHTYIHTYIHTYMASIVQCSNVKCDMKEMVNRPRFCTGSTLNAACPKVLHPHT